MSDTLAFEDLENVYDLIALAIDAAGPDKESLFLGKLCLALSHNIGDLSVIEQSIAIAKADLET